MRSGTGVLVEWKWTHDLNGWSVCHLCRKGLCGLCWLEEEVKGLRLQQEVKPAAAVWDCGAGARLSADVDLANQLAHLEQIATLGDVEGDGLVGTVDARGGNLHTSEITSPEAPLTCTTLPLTEMVMPDVVISTLSCST